MTDPSPDVVIVVLDCVRNDLLEAELAAGHLPHLAAVRDEMVRYSGAIAPASWTIPSHASLFTGRYPWDHGAHYKGGAILGPGLPTLAEFLRERGYRTVSLSANGYIQPGTGLTRGFDRTAWGGDREFFLRCIARTPSSPPLNGAGAAVHAILGRPSTAPAWRVGAMRALSRFTPVCDLVNRVGGQVTGLPARRVAGWIEAEFDRELVAAGDRPVFGFVNLLEAHEPYLADAGRPIGVGAWLSYARTTQVTDQWIRGERAPSARDLDWARRGYRSALRTLDERVGGLIERMKARHRWDRAMVVITSDHGQLFGEGGGVYHRLRLEEGITRIPLWYKPAECGPAGRPDDRWVSLIDVPATVTHAVAPGMAFGDPGAVPLDLGADPGRTVYSMTDGVSGYEARTLPPARRAELDRVLIAGYRGAFKVVVGADDAREVARFAQGRLSPAAADDPEYSAAAFDDLPQKLAAVLSLPAPTSVSQRIAGWGY